VLRERIFAEIVSWSACPDTSPIAPPAMEIAYSPSEVVVLGSVTSIPVHYTSFVAVAPRRRLEKVQAIVQAISAL